MRIFRCIFCLCPLLNDLLSAPSWNRFPKTLRHSLWQNVRTKSRFLESIVCFCCLKGEEFWKMKIRQWRFPMKQVAIWRDVPSRSWFVVCSSSQWTLRSCEFAASMNTSTISMGRAKSTNEFEQKCRRTDEFKSLLGFVDIGHVSTTASIGAVFAVFVSSVSFLNSDSLIRFVSDRSLEIFLLQNFSKVFNWEKLKIVSRWKANDFL